MKASKRFVKKYLHWFILLITALVCAIFIIAGTKNENGYITLDGKDAVIEEGTKDFEEESKAAFNRIMNEDKPTDEATEQANDTDEVGLGFYTTIDAILGRRLSDGDNDGGRGWQCSKYTAYLATGKREYSAVHPDYGPRNGKDIAKYLVDNYGFKYIDQPVAGAIGSGGFNTLYGHTVMYLYSTGTNTAMVNDANYIPLRVSTHNMNISGYKWVVPGNYNPKPNPTPTPAPAPTPTPAQPSKPAATSDKCKVWNVQRGDTMGKIMLACKGKVEWGNAMDEYAKHWYSTKLKRHLTVYDGWASVTRYGLFAGDTIEYREN